MASRKQQEAPRNDALAMLTQLAGHSEGWDKGVAAAKEAAFIAEEVYALRERHGLTQAELAALIDTSQSAVARLEDAKYRGHSMSVLRRIAAAVGEHVVVRFIATTAAGKQEAFVPKRRPVRDTKPTVVLPTGSERRQPDARRQPAPAKGTKVTA